MHQGGQNERHDAKHGVDQTNQQESQIIRMDGKGINGSDDAGPAPHNPCQQGNTGIDLIGFQHVPQVQTLGHVSRRSDNCVADIQCGD